MPKKVEECVNSVMEDDPDKTESEAWAICKSQLESKEIEEVTSFKELGVGPEHISELESWSQHDDGVWGNVEKGFVVYQNDELDSLSIKGVYEGYTLGTDGDPGSDASFTSFMDALVREGADVWQVRNGELHTWDDDSDSFPRHDPVIKIIGISESAIQDAMDKYNVEFMSLSEGV